jgi:hypothetical protein
MGNKKLIYYMGKWRDGDADGRVMHSRGADKSFVFPISATCIPILILSHQSLLFCICIILSHQSLLFCICMTQIS